MRFIFRIQRRLIAWILLLAWGSAAYAQLNWTPHGNPVLSAGSGSAWDSEIYPGTFGRQARKHLHDVV